MCDVCVAHFSYLLRISDVRVAYLASQWRMCYMCHVRFAAVWFERHIRGNMNILWRAKRILMLLYKCFRFSDASHGSRCRAGFIQGYAWFSLCLCSCRLTTRMGSLEMVLSPPSPRIFSSVLI